MNHERIALEFFIIQLFYENTDLLLKYALKYVLYEYAKRRRPRRPVDYTVSGRSVTVSGICMRVL